MRFIQITTLVSIFFVTSALAGYNCKCQDSNGQYDDLTKQCCDAQISLKPTSFMYYPGPNHQCASKFNEIDSGAFVGCCKNKGVGGAFCWK